MGMLIFMVVLNLLISTFNAWSCGKSWVYTKEAGGISHFMTWMGAIMSACGFTWCYTIIIAGLTYAFGYLDQEVFIATLSLGYLAIIFPVLGSGIAITVQSWVHFIRKPGLLNGGITAWNTFAQIRNTMNAVHAVPAAFEKVAGALTPKKGSNDNNGGAIMILIVLFALFSGILTTRWIILSTAKKADYFA